MVKMAIFIVRLEMISMFLEIFIITEVVTITHLSDSHKY